MFRVLDYVMQVYKKQLREWGETHPSYAGFHFRPVLPIVLYTGFARWEEPTPLVKLTQAGEMFRDVLPELKPIFLNLSTTPDEQLRQKNGPFSQILRLMRRRHAKPAEFRTLLAESLRCLEEMPKAERLRWLELLTYVNAFVYHYREPAEQPGLHEVILNSVQTDELRQEVNTMRRSMADVNRDEGIVLGKRQALLRQLRKRFTQIPDPIEARVEAEQNVDELDRWLDNVITAKRLADVVID